MYKCPLHLISLAVIDRSAFLRATGQHEEREALKEAFHYLYDAIETLDKEISNA